MALAVGTVATTTGSFVSEGAQSFSVSLSAAGNDRILLIWNMSKDADDPSEAPAYDVILDAAGVNKSFLGGGISRVGAAQLAQEGNFSSASDVFVVREPDLPISAGTYQIDVRHTASGSGESVRGLMWAAVEITGASDKIPVVLNQGTDTANISTGTWDTHTVTTTVDNSIVFATFGISLGGSSTSTSDPYTGGTEIVDLTLQYGLGHTNHQTVAAAGSVTVGQRVNATTNVRHAWHILQIEPATSGGITGSATPTEDDDTGTASGEITTFGSGAPIEDGGTGAASGGIFATGAAAATEEEDTGSASGIVGVSGSAATEEDDDAGAATGAVSVVGSASAVEDNDTGSASGTVGGGIYGSAAAIEDDDTGAANGDLSSIGSAAATEADDAGSASGQVSVLGSASAIEDVDTGSASGAVGNVIYGSASSVEGDDIGLASGDVSGNGIATGSGGTGGSKPQVFQSPRRARSRKKTGEPKLRLADIFPDQKDITTVKETKTDHGGSENKDERTNTPQKGETVFGLPVGPKSPVFRINRTFSESGAAPVIPIQKREAAETPIFFGASSSKETDIVSGPENQQENNVYYEKEKPSPFSDDDDEFIFIIMLSEV